MTRGDPERFVDISPDRLRTLYVRHDGTVAAVADDLGCSWTWARNLLERHDLYESTPHQATQLEQLDPDELGHTSGGEA